MFSHKAIWESSRFSTCYILKALGCKGLDKSSDLVTFPWETSGFAMTEEEEKEELARLREMNEKFGGKPRLMND